MKIMRFDTGKPLSQPTELRGITLQIAINFVIFGNSLCLVEIMSLVRDVDMQLPSEFNPFSIFANMFINKNHLCFPMSSSMGVDHLPFSHLNNATRPKASATHIENCLLRK